jgi:transposase
LLERQWRCIGDVAKLTPKGASPERFAPAQESTVAHEVAADAGTLAAGTVDTSTAGQQRSRDARDRRLQKYQQVMELHGQGLPIREIARRLGIHRETVDRFTRAGAFLERVPRRYASGSDQIADAIRRRWQEGCHNARQIARELAAQGFKGSYYMVRRRVHKMRLRGEIAVDDVTETAAAAAEPLSPTRLSWILLREENELDEQGRSVVEAVCRQCAEVQSARNLSHEFRRLVGQRHGDRLDAWVTRATAETAPREISSFAACLKQDYDAVKAGLTLEWSNGQVEGQVNRLKLLKRQMYGRAGFDLLRARVLRAG